MAWSASSGARAATHGRGLCAHRCARPERPAPAGARSNRRSWEPHFTYRHTRPRPARPRAGPAQRFQRRERAPPPRRRNRRAATVRPGADSRAAPPGRPPARAAVRLVVRERPADSTSLTAAVSRWSTARLEMPSGIGRAAAVADDGQTAAVPNAVQRAVEHRRPSLVSRGPRRCPPRRHASGAGAADVPLRRRTLNRVRLPAPVVAVVRQPDGSAAREDGGAPRRHPVEAGRFVPIDEHRPRRPASRQAHAYVAVGVGAGQPRRGA